MTPTSSESICSGNSTANDFTNAEWMPSSSAMPITVPSSFVIPTCAFVGVGVSACVRAGHCRVPLQSPPSSSPNHRDTIRSLIPWRLSPESPVVPLKPAACRQATETRGCNSKVKAEPPHEAMWEYNAQCRMSHTNTMQKQHRSNLLSSK